jgi:hypothetical protein
LVLPHHQARRRHRPLTPDAVVTSNQASTDTRVAVIAAVTLHRSSCRVSSQPVASRLAQ